MKEHEPRARHTTKSIVHMFVYGVLVRMENRYKFLYAVATTQNWMKKRRGKIRGRSDKWANRPCCYCYFYDDIFILFTVALLVFFVPFGCLKIAIPLYLHCMTFCGGMVRLLKHLISVMWHLFVIIDAIGEIANSPRIHKRTSTRIQNEREREEWEGVAFKLLTPRKNLLAICKPGAFCWICEP